MEWLSPKGSKISLVESLGFEDLDEKEVISPAQVQAYFTRSNGDYVFARWGRPIVPIVFGVEDETLSLIKGACEAVVSLAGHKMAETDPELGANLMVFFCREWSELPEVPNLEKLVPDLVPLVGRLQDADANQYRAFRFDEDGGIKACFVFIRMDAAMAEVSADTLALGQMIQSILLWSDEAFLGGSPMARLPDGRVVMKPEVGAVISAAYDPVLPVVAHDASHALRLFARMQQV